ncbi:GntR family transcriptional regulator [Microbacterium sp. ET2]|uniref:GntR family transcriptional regulator n=1 Tax=Microbacterium albipurpureum TaxID=3050384 RepID=UPI00259CAE3E|nr:GntR family transcriptional regulator [Microbacterium sp. ET2 (Ac-2212)]WJL94781.1 GntR family transcriptional regulator [Microbacterium sp. ET2 (Ac-2212)]
MPETIAHPRAHGGSARGAQISARRVRDLLLAAIRAGRITPGSSLNEEHLMQTYSASRGAVRSALSQLTSIGILERRTRVGTRLVNAGVRIGVTDFAFGERGGVAIDVLEQRLVPSTPLLRERLQLDDEVVRMVENAFTLKGETIGIRTAYFSQAVTSDPTAIRQPATMSTVMRDFFGKEPGLVYAWIGAEISDARTSRILGIAEGAPLLRRELVYLDVDDDPIQVVFDAFRADRVSFDRGPISFS